MTIHEASDNTKLVRGGKSDFEFKTSSGRKSTDKAFKNPKFTESLETIENNPKTQKILEKKFFRPKRLFLKPIPNWTTCPNNKNTGKARRNCFLKPKLKKNKSPSTQRLCFFYLYVTIHHYYPVADYSLMFSPFINEFFKL